MRGSWLPWRIAAGRCDCVVHPRYCPLRPHGVSQALPGVASPHPEGVSRLAGWIPRRTIPAMLKDSKRAARCPSEQLPFRAGRAAGLVRRFPRGGDPRPGVDVLQVCLDRVHRHKAFVCDLGVGEARRPEPQHQQLALGEDRRRLARRAAGSGRGTERHRQTGTGYHLDHPYSFDAEGYQSPINYEPAESATPMFGGNSNWRGPVWMPINYLVMDALARRPGTGPSAGSAR
jgi:hypothetical protein